MDAAGRKTFLRPLGVIPSLYFPLLWRTGERVTGLGTCLITAVRPVQEDRVTAAGFPNACGMGRNVCGMAADRMIWCPSVAVGRREP